MSLRPGAALQAALVMVVALIALDGALRFDALAGYSPLEWRQYGLGAVGSVGWWWGLFSLAAVPVARRWLDAVRCAVLATLGAALLFVPVTFWLLQRRFPNEAAYLFFANEWRFVLSTVGDRWDARPMVVLAGALGAVVTLGAYARREVPSPRTLALAVVLLVADAVTVGVSRLSPSMPLAADANSLRFAARVLSWRGAPPRFFQLAERVPSWGKRPLPTLPFNVLFVVHETVGQAYLRSPTGVEVAPRLLALRADPAVAWLERLNAVSSCTDVSVPSILTGVSSAAGLTWQRTASLPFELARAAGAYTFVSASQRMTWANLRTYLDAPAFAHFRGAEDFQLDSDDDRGVPDALAYADALAAMDEAQRQGKRFVGLLRTNATHGPYQVDPADQPFHDDLGFGPGEAGGFVNYLNALHRLDRGFGEFWAGFQARPFFDDTLVVVTADHGESFGQHGLWAHCGNFYPEESRVPGALRFPKVLREYASRAAQVAQVRAAAAEYTTTTQLMPTVAELLGWTGELGPQFDAPSLTQPPGVGRPVVFTNCSDLRECASADLGFFEAGLRFVFSSEGKRWQVFDDVADPWSEHDVAAGQAAAVQAGLERLEASEREGGVVRRVVGGKR